MIDITLVDKPVNIENYQPFDRNRPCLFLGFAIKNEYDNQRLKIFLYKKYLKLYL